MNIVNWSFEKEGPCDHQQCSHGDVSASLVMTMWWQQLKLSERRWRCWWSRWGWWCSPPPRCASPRSPWTPVTSPTGRPPPSPPVPQMWAGRGGIPPRLGMKGDTRLLETIFWKECNHQQTPLPSDLPLIIYNFIAFYPLFSLSSFWIIILIW